jgi:hypothetical protein
MDGLLYLALLVAAILFWLDSRRAHEFALGICKHLCEKENMILLDQTVSLSKLSLAKRDGRTVFARTFRFEFSDHVDERQQGELLMHGTEPISASMFGETTYFH